MAKLPPKPWADTYVFGGLDRIYRIWEDMRARNTDGYVPTANGGGILANIDPHGGLAIVPGTTCSPFTGTVIGLAFDPTYPRNDLPGPSKANNWKGGDAYKPMFNGGKDPMPWTAFYTEHNIKNRPIEAIVEYGLGKEVDKKEMRRGDCLGIKWNTGGGHAVFCWDVHLNDKGEVDAFQYLGANSSPGNCGVTIGNCAYGTWLKGTPKLYRDQHKDQTFTGLENARAPEPVFKDEDLVVQKGQWLVLPGVPEGSVDLSTFRVRPQVISYPKAGTFTVGDVKVGRLNYKETPPAPYCMKSGGANAMKGNTATKSNAQVVAPPPVVVPKAEVKKDAEAPKKIAPKPAQQDEKKPLSQQLEVENALQFFFAAGWIQSDPGKPDAVNDEQSKKAIKEYQTLFDLLVDGIVGKQTLGSVRQQVGAALTHTLSQVLLLQLYRGKKISTDPGLPDGKNHDQCRKAVEEFQGANGLKKTGVPDADTVVKLRAALDEHAPTGAKPGLAPEIKHLYWVGNSVDPGGTATLRLHANDLKVDQQVPVTLLDADGKEFPSTAQIKVSGKDGETPVAIPKDFAAGAKVYAKVKADLNDDGELEAKTAAPLYVRGAAGALEVFFNFKGKVGEGKREREHTYVGYKVAGKPQAWFVKGRFMTDVDGAPNCYHPDDLNVRLDYPKFDIMAHKGALDWRRNGGHPGNWFGVLTDTQQVTGTPVIQGPGDPFPGFYIATTSLVDKSKKARDPKRYVDARQIPYIAFPYQLWAESGPRFERVTKGATGTIGDFLTVVNPKADEAHRFAHAIFADMGGRDDPHFGEGSPALGLKVQAHGLAEAGLLFILYPHSGAGQGTIPTAEQIHEKGQKLFDEWGGIDEANRVLGLMPKE